MEPLFKTTTDYTPEVLERMNRKVLMKSKPFITAITIMAVLIVLFTAAWVHNICIYAIKRKSAQRISFL